MKHTIHFLAKNLLLLGAMNYLFISVMNVNIFSLIKSEFIVKLIFILIGISAIYFMFDRDFYLPFLGECVIPVGDSKINESKNVIEVVLTELPPNVNVMFWASGSSDAPYDSPQKAYGDYLNSGFVKTDKFGHTTFKINCPSEYIVPIYGKLEKHVHYRYELPGQRGMFSRVYTQKIDC